MALHDPYALAMPAHDAGHGSRPTSPLIVSIFILILLTIRVHLVASNNQISRRVKRRPMQPYLRIRLPTPSRRQTLPSSRCSCLRTRISPRQPGDSPTPQQRLHRFVYFIHLNYMPSLNTTHRVHHPSASTMTTRMRQNITTRSRALLSLQRLPMSCQ